MPEQWEGPMLPAAATARTRRWMRPAPVNVALAHVLVLAWFTIVALSIGLATQKMEKRLLVGKVEFYRTEAARAVGRLSECRNDSIGDVWRSAAMTAAEELRECRMGHHGERVCWPSSEACHGPSTWSAP